MTLIRRAPLAEADYREIWRHIAHERLEAYVQQPDMGTNRSRLARGLRSFSVASYVAFYRVIPEGIELVRVLRNAAIKTTRSEKGGGKG